MTRQRALTQIHFAAVLFGLTGVFGELIQASAAVITLGRAIFAGVVLVFAHDLSFGGGGEVLLGSLFVFGSAASYSVYLICSGELIKRVGPTRLVAYAMLVSCVACIIQFFVIHPPSMLIQPAGVYGYSVIHATLNTVVPVFMLMWAVSLIGAPTASLLGMVGPVSVLFLASWFLDEPVTAWQLAGTALVLAGVFVLMGGGAAKPPPAAPGGSAPAR